MMKPITPTLSAHTEPLLVTCLAKVSIICDNIKITVLIFPYQWSKSLVLVDYIYGDKTRSHKVKL